MMNKLERKHFSELIAAHRKLKESQRFLRQLMACVCLKYGNVVLDTTFYRLPKEPEILTHQNEHGETVVRLRRIETLDAAKHDKWADRRKAIEGN